MKIAWRSALAPGALFAALAGLHLWSLLRFPFPFVDEAWCASRAWAFLSTGRAFGPLDAGVFDRFDGYWTFFPWIPTWLQSLSLRWFPEPSLLGVRLVSLAFGFVLLGAVYAIGNRLGGRRLALLGVLFVALSRPFFFSAHMARYDVIATALGFAAIAIHLRVPPSRAYLDLVSGLLVGLAFEAHTNAAMYGLAVVALSALRARGAVLRDRKLWWFAAGAGGGLLVYAALHVFRYPATYFALNKLIFAPTHTPPIVTLDPLVILQSIGDTGRLLWDAYWVLPVLILWALVALARRGSDEDHVLIVLAVVLVFSEALLVRNRPTYYAILVTPSVDLVLAAFVKDVLERPRERSVGFFARHAVVWSLCAAALAHNLLPLRADASEAYEDVRRRVERSVEPGDSIMAAQTYWFGLHRHVFTPWEMLVYHRRYQPEATLEGALKVFRPDLFVVDGQMGQWIRDEPATSVYSQHLYLPRTELSSLLSEQGQVVDAFDGGPYGTVVVFRLGRTE